jgi:hypothetical protein
MLTSVRRRWAEAASGASSEDPNTSRLDKEWLVIVKALEV